MLIYKEIHCRSCLTSLIALLLFIIQAHSGSDSGYVVTASVSNEERLSSDDASELSIKITPQGTYKKARENVHHTRLQVNNTFAGKKHSDDSLYIIAGKALEECIVNKLIPFWYGTPWDFNGYTHIPNNGVVACGYFVSTVLYHTGFSLNRYTLAQQAPYFEAVSLQLNDSIHIYRNGFADFNRNFKTDNVEGLYFAGLDNHVGFLLYRGDHLLFIHSSYVPPFCVTIESVANSPAFTAARTYYIAEISNNRKLVDCWLKGRKIAIRTDR